MSSPTDAGGEDLPFLPPPLPAESGPPAARSAEHSAADSGGAPVLPPAPKASFLTSPVALSPVVPPPPPPVAQDPTSTETAAFDARAMVDAQKRSRPGARSLDMPVGTEEGRAAAQQRRVEANRKRRRNRKIAWIVALVLLGGILAGGYAAYREYQADQDRRSASIDDL